MSITKRGARVGLLMAAGAALLYWASHHSEASFADGLRYVRQAQRIDNGDFAGGIWRSIDHPMHPLAIAGAHEVLGGEGPFAWQTAAQAASVFALTLAILPIYFLSRELFEDDNTAALGCLLVVTGPVARGAAVNVQSETTFLLFWAWGLWSASRFLRNGRFGWLVPAVGFGALAYLARPEGLLIHLGLVLTLFLLPFHRGIHILWPRWWAAVALLVLGPLATIGPYMAAKGGVGTKPAVARLIGAEPSAPPQALERERTLPPEQTTVATYAIATCSAGLAVMGAVTPPMLPFSAVGLVVALRKVGRRRARAWVFLGVVAALAVVGLVRLHATGGYCTPRHALIPGAILSLAAAHGMICVMRSVSIDGRRLGLGAGLVRPGPGVWAAAVLAVVLLPVYMSRTPYASSFAPYRMAGAWIAGRPESDGRVLDLTDWSLFFGDRVGAGFPDVFEAVDDPKTRFIVLRDAQLDGDLQYKEAVRQRLGGRSPVASFPDGAVAGQVRVKVYDLASDAPAQAVADVEGPEGRVR